LDSSVGAGLVGISPLRTAFIGRVGHRFAESSHRQRQRGAVLVEAAIVTPLLIGLLLGLFDVGVAWRANTNLSRDLHGVVLGAARHNGDRLTDFEVLRAVTHGLGDNESLNWVIVYKTDSTRSEPSASCVATAEALVVGTTGENGVCNIYSGAYALTATAADFVDPNCASEPDRPFCPTGRSALSSTDRLGVALSVDHEWITGFLGDSLTMTDHAVSPPISGIEDARTP
jgi:Flp pilus assembly protein TadG